MGGFTNDPASGGQFNRPMQFTDLPMEVQEQVATQMAGSSDPMRISSTLSMIQADPMIGEQALRMVPQAGAGRPSMYGEPANLPPPGMPNMPQQPPPEAQFGGGQGMPPPGFGQDVQPAPYSPPFEAEFNAPADDGFGVKDAILTTGAVSAAAGGAYAGKKMLDANMAKNAPPPAQPPTPAPRPSRGNPAPQQQMELFPQKPSGQMELPFPGDANVDSLKPPSKFTTGGSMDTPAGQLRGDKPFPNDANKTENKIWKNITEQERATAAKNKSKNVKPATKQADPKVKAWSDVPKGVEVVNIQGESTTYYKRKDSGGIDRYYTKNKKGELTHVGNRKEQALKHANKGATEKTKTTKADKAKPKEKALVSKKQVDKKANPPMKKKATRKSRANANNTKRAKAKNTEQTVGMKNEIEKAAKGTALSAKDKSKAVPFESKGYGYLAKETPNGIKIYRKNGQIAGDSVQKRAMKDARAAVGKTKTTMTRQQANAIRKNRPNPTKAQQEAAKGASVAGKNAKKVSANKAKRQATIDKAAARAAAKALK